MLKLETAVVDIHQDGPVRWLWLNRPVVKNAMNGEMIAQLHGALHDAEQAADVRVVVLAGRGSDFCSGADLLYMQHMATEPEQNHQASLALSALFRGIALCSKPVVARVQGVCFAGAMGLACASDVLVACDDARFCLPEVRRGLIPATISPFVLQALGVRAMRRYMLTGEVFSATQAHVLGMVHEVCEASVLDEVLHGVVDAVLKGAPSAVTAAKRLVRDVSVMDPYTDATHQSLARRLAEIRATDEATEGMAAFLERRQPWWSS